VAAVAPGPADRSSGVPLGARDLGDGRSVWKPVDSGSTALVFDNRTGAVVGRCDGVMPPTRDLASAALAACVSGRWLLAGGTIRFSSTSPPGAATASDPPLATGVAIALRDGVYPAPAACFSEARKTVRSVADGSLQIADVPIDPGHVSTRAAGAAEASEGGERFIAWHCLVSPRADGRWSGRIELVGEGWTIGSTSSTRRVCRYVRGGADAIDANIAAGGDNIDVEAVLSNRNFLVVRGSEGCPGEPQSARTAPHQP
jgi:hypothetical protein